MVDECEHDLICISQPIASSSSSVTFSRGLYYPPYFKCTICRKIFTVSKQQDNRLIEVKIME